MSDGERQALADTSRRLCHNGINVGSAGNLSVRVDNGFLITPSGTPNDRLSAGDMVSIDSDGQVSGAGKPSSEWRFHQAIYRAVPGAGAVVHTHSPFAVSLACLRKPIPAFHYEVAFAGGKEIPCAAYATYGTGALSDNILSAMGNLRACLVENHGLVCHGASLEAAEALAIKIEQLAMIYVQCLQVGEPVLLSDSEMDEVLSRFETYGSH